MKSLLFCTSYFSTAEAWHLRYARWIDYYSKLAIDDATLLLIDDHSPYTPPADQVRLITNTQALTASAGIPQLLRFEQRLGRPAPDRMPGWWRSFLHSVVAAKAMGAQKIIHIESDAFVLSKALLDHLTGLTTGWNALWTPHYEMPETAIQVICEDQFDAMEQLRQRPLHEWDGLEAEKTLPFTAVSRNFKGERYGELRAHRGIFRSSRFNGWPIFQHEFFWAKIPADADFAAQVIPQQVLRTPLCQPAWVPPFPLPPRDPQLRRKKS